ncbi:hypothetical protein [Thermodesulfovibrio yellowstonii]|nr:hypothetical protein [Thermodesulfovibrio islandicus]
MLKIVWQSYQNGNGLKKVMVEEKLIPMWQLHDIFLNALRNLKIGKKERNKLHSLEPKKAIRNANGETVDYYYPANSDILEQKSVVKSMPKKERKQWLGKIRRLKKKGLSDDEIIKMLASAAQLKKKCYEPQE